MTARLDDLVRTGQLKSEPPAQAELDGLVRSGLARLNDAENSSLSLDGRFDLAYNAAHALSLAALRWHGYRSDNRYLVLQTLPVTLGLSSEQWRVLDTAHRKRNYVEYEGVRAGAKPRAGARFLVTWTTSQRHRPAGTRIRPHCGHRVSEVEWVIRVVMSPRSRRADSPESRVGRIDHSA